MDTAGFVDMGGNAILAAIFIAGYDWSQGCIGE
jgi:hypothetical protein